MNPLIATALTLSLAASAHAGGEPTKHNIVDTAVAAGQFETLAAALGAAGLVDTLKGDGPFTVFAPTDEAFAKIPQSTLESLLQPKNRDRLANILKYHIVAGRVFAADAINASSAPALQKDRLDFGIRGGSLRVNDAKVIANDLQASNGVIHVIDSVLMPPEPERPRGAKFFGLSSERPSAALASQLGIKRNDSLVITRVVDGSQAEAAGLKRYDVLIKVAGMKATDQNVSKAKNERDYGEAVKFEVFRGGKRQKLDILIGEQKH